MAADDVRTRLRRRLAEEYGMDEADLLLDRPPGGWDEVVTKEWLHLELAQIDARFAGVEVQFVGINDRLGSLEREVTQIHSRLDDLFRELNRQTWRLVGVLMTGMSIAIAAASAIAVVS